MKKLVEYKDVEAIAKKYGFSVEDQITSIHPWYILTKNTDGKLVPWISINLLGDTFFWGDTKELNIWLHETRPDLTVETLVALKKDLMEMTGIMIYFRDFVASEDWQKIANVSDADKDKRYNPFSA